MVSVILVILVIFGSFGGFGGLGIFSRGFEIARTRYAVHVMAAQHVHACNVRTCTFL